MLVVHSEHSVSLWKSWGINKCCQRNHVTRKRGGCLTVRAGRLNKERLSKEWVLAIDVGTAGTKAALISSAGRVCASAFAAHPAPANVGVRASMEQEQESWWLATKNAVWSCLGSSAAVAQGVSVAQVCTIAVTGQMQDVILLPKPGMHPRENAILYSDARAELEAVEKDTTYHVLYNYYTPLATGLGKYLSHTFRRSIVAVTVAELWGIQIGKLAGDPAHVTSITGFSQGASSVLAKLRWLDKHESKAVEDCESLLLGSHDYVVWKLCGICVTDATTASTTGLTMRSFQYAEDLLRDVKLDHWIDKLPKIHPTDCPCGEVNEWAAMELGCAAFEGVPVLHVCGDAGACTLGAGAGECGSLYAYLGTSGWVAGSFLNKTAQDTKFVPNPPGVFTLAHPESLLVFKTGSILNAGGNIEWAASNLTEFSRKEPAFWDRFNNLATSAPAGCGGLLYLPYLNGERCPFEDRNARACFLGISATTTRGHLIRAVMEGVAFAMRSARDAISADQFSEDLSGSLRLVGGGARSPLWPAIMAGVFGQTVDVLEDAQEVGVKGAALLAGRWLGWQSTDGSWTRVKRSFHPSTGDIENYQEMYTIYKEAYGALRHVFQRLAKK